MKKTIIALLAVCIMSLSLVFGLTTCKKECTHMYDSACDATCNECGEERAVTHTPAADDGDCTTAITCKDCGTVTTTAKANHTPNADDGDCTTAITCQHCDTVMTAGKTTHTAEADDGNCTTAQNCTVCGQVAVAAKDAHNDTDHDYLCDNAGCQVTVGNPPEDTNPGIDLPIDTNN